MNIHDPLARYSDVELLRREREMRLKAWDAPKSLEGNYNDAQARWGDEWAQLHQEARRRGLQPSTADPEFRSQTRE